MAAQLQQVANFLIALRAGNSWATAQFDIENSQRAGVQAITFAVLRHLGQAHALRVALAPKKPVPAADALLMAALGLLCAQNADHPPPGAVYADHVIVSQAVDAIKRQPHLAAQSSFINACLRRFLRERTQLLASLRGNLEAQFNHPLWWVRQLQKDWPDHWQALLQGNRRSAPLTLRIFEQKCSLAGMESALNATEFIANSTDVQIKRVASAGLELSRSLPVSQLPGYNEGWFSVQDAAAQLAAPLLLDALPKSQQTLRILDACAAPGGKTTHLLEWAAARGIAVEVTALDVDAQRCERINENLQRLGLQAKIVVADAAKVSEWHDNQPFDGILLDAPCTASGIVRRHPDIPWLRRDTDIANLAAQQKRLLHALWPLVKPGGALLYCTCSIFKAEGSAQIEAFLNSFAGNNTLVQSLPAPGHLLPLNCPSNQSMPENSLGGHDGFFYALLRKAATD
ncbi:MAG: 16S rRNA (cytosine(967)-C(5))-methyltransferase RsmB [Brachymonas sp.]|nr:16S rRNA (cytosine(967)-C(5))-methyltransferase RsmB [Brachymonas sp.]